MSCTSNNGKADKEATAVSTSVYVQKESTEKSSADTSESKTSTTKKQKKENTKKPKQNTSKSTTRSKRSGKSETAKTTGSSKTTTKKEAAKPESETTTHKKAETTTRAKNICYVTIQCKSILSNMEDLKPGHSKYVPENGIILNSYPYVFHNGDSVYDALKATCKTNHIKLTASSSLYGVYIVGINNLDEKDCGKYSGWKYKVNGIYPSVSCDKTAISSGDRIEFEYVCKY